MSGSQVLVDGEWLDPLVSVSSLCEALSHVLVRKCGGLAVEDWQIEQDVQRSMVLDEYGGSAVNARRDHRWNIPRLSVMAPGLRSPRAWAEWYGVESVHLVALPCGCVGAYL